MKTMNDEYGDGTDCTVCPKCGLCSTCGDCKCNNMKNKIVDKCDEIKNFLLEKNKAYGNSALDPINIFSKTTALEQIAVRIDDKLNRLKKGSEFQGDDTVKDLAGYLILYLIAMENENA